jgi:transcriptional regulator of acetoin/glycerol metabolism
MGHTKSLYGTVGDSATVPAMAEMILKVAPHEFTVLIRGELATGNELIAHSIQRNSNRVKGPFLAINCGSTPETVMEAHLFGHQKGDNPGRSDRHGRGVATGRHAPQLRIQSEAQSRQIAVITVTDCCLTVEDAAAGDIFQLASSVPPAIANERPVIQTKRKQKP